MADKIIIQHKNIICVEGKDEVAFLEAFLEYCGIQNVQIINFQGKDNFKKSTENLLFLPNFEIVEKIILIRDADFGENASENAFKSLQNALSKAGFPCPIKQKQWTENATNKIQTAIYIMPNEGAEGMLENLCLESIKPEQMKCIEMYLACMPEKPDNKNIPKAKIQVFLAAKKEPIYSLGTAAKRKFWDFENNIFQDLKNLLKNL